MQIKLERARQQDATALVALRAAVNQHLASKFGEGYWIAKLTERGALFAMRMSMVYVARDENGLIATLALAKKKPWSIDKTYFTRSERPLYLLAMAVHPRLQSNGIGTECIAQVRRIALAHPADAIRLDAYDTSAGAGDFYRKCGFSEVGRVTYRNVPLVYYEMLL
jgi:ribosomal protein S18 acetylase RimI-like enzyme